MKFALLVSSFAFASACTQNNPSYTPSDAAMSQRDGSPQSDGSGSVDAGVQDQAVDLTTPPDLTSTSSLTASPLTVDFGHANCGGAAPMAQILMVSNAGSADVAFTASIDNPVFTFGAAPQGDMLNGGTLSGTITGATSQDWSLKMEAVAKASTAGVAITGTLTITTSAGTTSVPLSVMPYGATIVVMPKPTGAIDWDYGIVTVDTTKTSTALTLANTGNTTVGVTIGKSSDTEYTASVPAGTVLTSTPVTVTSTYTPNAPTSTMATFKVNVTPAGTPICGTSLTSLVFAGTGSGASTPTFSISPTSIDFTQACGATMTSDQTITITATSATTFTWSASITGSGTTPDDTFTATPSSGSVTNGTTDMFQISSATIDSATSVTAPTYGATLIVTINRTPYTATITETAEGVIMTSTPTMLTMKSPGMASFTVSNTGTPESGLSYDAELGTAMNGTFSIMDGTQTDSWTVVCGLLGAGVMTATDTVNVTVSSTSNMDLPICNAGDTLSIPVTCEKAIGPTP